MHELLPEQERTRPWFNAVADPANWKNPINTKIRFPPDHADLKRLPTAKIIAEAREEFLRSEIDHAVRFHAGCVPKISVAQDEHGWFLHVQAIGYYAAVGA